MAMAMALPLLPAALPALLLVLLVVGSTPALCASAGGTIVFATIGRSRYAFDIFSLPLPSLSTAAAEEEVRLTDGASVNYNGNFAPSSGGLLFVSERNGSLNVYLSASPGGASRREALEDEDGSVVSSPVLPWDPVALKDRPSLTPDGSRLVYVSTALPAASPRRSWAAVYSTHLPSGHTRRLTPLDVADFSPAVSPSGEWTAAASPGPAGWTGEVQDLRTDIYVFRTDDGSRRTLAVHDGGWPCWADETTIFFHRRDSDGWYGVYRAKISVTEDGLSPAAAAAVERITPPGFHAFTPAASPGAPGSVAVATRRPGSDYRHIEVIDVSNGAYFEVTRSVAPRVHHFNPFISPDGGRVGYHRCRGSRNGDSPLLLENLKSPAAPDAFSLFRIDGMYPSFSHDGKRIAFVGLPGLFVVNSDGSGGRREIFSGNAFATAWDWKRQGVIYTSVGPEFATESTEVDVVAVSLGDDDDDGGGGGSSQISMKKLTTGGNNNAFPSPSPDGKWVVFRSGRSGHKNLYIMDAEDGEAGGVRRLTEGPWSDTMCNWSPDGEWIAFASDRHNPGGGSFAIYIIHPNGTALRRLVHSAAAGRTNHPWFSPDSKSIVFTSDLAAVSAEPISNPHHYQPYGEIFTINIDGSNLERLTHNSFEDGTPAWSPYSLEPRDVGETLQASGRCAFRDCHWLSIDNAAQSGDDAHDNKISCGKL